MVGVLKSVMSKLGRLLAACNGMQAGDLLRSEAFVTGCYGPEKSAIKVAFLGQRCGAA